jgi:hypothetical protein
MKKFCKEHNITENQFKGIDKIEGYLDLRSLTTIPEGFNPTVGGYLDLRSLTSIPEGFNPTVGGWLDLHSLTSIPEGFNPTVGGNLDLSSLTSIPEGFNPTVGGYLDLESLTSIPEGFNPTVGYNLYLNNLTSIPEGFNPTVGYSLYLPEGLTCNYTKLNENHLFSWQDGKYIKVDGIFTEVVKQKGNVYHVKKLNEDKVFYLITDGERWSHGDTLKEAKEDLVYKVTNKTKDDYKLLTKTSVLTFEEAVVCYRVITGACSFGVKDFVKNKLEKVEKNYSIETIIEKTIGCYGNEEFKKYFK